MFTRSSGNKKGFLTNNILSLCVPTVTMCILRCSGFIRQESIPHVFDQEDPIEVVEESEVSDISFEPVSPSSIDSEDCDILQREDEENVASIITDDENIPCDFCHCTWCLTHNYEPCDLCNNSFHFDVLRSCTACSTVFCESCTPPAEISVVECCDHHHAGLYACSVLCRDSITPALIRQRYRILDPCL